MVTPVSQPRHLALLALEEIHKGAFADAALDKALRRSDLGSLDIAPQPSRDRSLVTELVYGTTRRQRTLDAIVAQLAKKPPDKQPPQIRLMLHLGLYQLRYLSQIPASAAVNTTVDLVNRSSSSGLAGFVNGLLRRYVRLSEQGQDPLQLPDDPIDRLGVQYSYPNWIVQVWLEQFGFAETEKLCDWMNQPPAIDLRINPLQASIEAVEAAMAEAEIRVCRLPHLPQALRLLDRTGAIRHLPGFEQGWWTVQDSSAQMVSHLLDPQPGEVAIDACAAPGGKTTHIAELMDDRGLVKACDLSGDRLKRLRQNIDRLHLTSIQTAAADSRTAQFDLADRVLLDVPCSGLGTLHRHADARWRQSPDSIRSLAQLQTELLQQVSTWVKPQGMLVYATCTLHPLENEAIVESFLRAHPHWQIEPPPANFNSFAADRGWLKVLPHQQQMDGFFMVRLRRSGLPT